MHCGRGTGSGLIVAPVVTVESRHVIHSHNKVTSCDTRCNWMRPILPQTETASMRVFRQCLRHTLAPDDFDPSGPMLESRPVLAIDASLVKYESAVGDWKMVLPTIPKTLARQRMRIFRDGFRRALVQRGYPLIGKSDVRPEVYASMRGRTAN